MGFSRGLHTGIHGVAIFEFQGLIPGGDIVEISFSILSLFWGVCGAVMFPISITQIF